MTFAVIHTGGKQYKVSANDTLRLEKLSVEEGQIVNFDQVLLTNKDDDIDIGLPLLEGAKVEGIIVRQTKNKTVIAFTKRRRQNSRRRKGHRQKISVVQIMKIFGKNGKLLSEATLEEKAPKVVAKKTETQKVATKKTKEKIETKNK
jgi:large subunit ribosomal protein L21